MFSLTTCRGGAQPAAYRIPVAVAVDVDLSCHVWRHHAALLLPGFPCSRVDRSVGAAARLTTTLYRFFNQRPQRPRAPPFFRSFVPGFFQRFKDQSVGGCKQSRLPTILDHQRHDSMCSSFLLIFRAGRIFNLDCD